MSETILKMEAARLVLEGNAGPLEILRGVTLSVARGESLGRVLDRRSRS